MSRDLSASSARHTSFLPKTPFKAIFGPAGRILRIFSFQNYNFFPIRESI